MWYALLEVDGDYLVGRNPEIPKEFEQHEVLRIPKDEIEDWMILDGGSLFGGRSLRYQRTKLPEAERPSFDKHIGVERYQPRQSSGGTNSGSAGTSPE
jgi:uncharacterized protein YegJ (DUF2314 family)